MKNLVLGTSIAAVASLTAGCVIETDNSGELGHISATWHMDTVDATGHVSPTACPAGFTTAALHTVAASDDGLALDACTTSNSNCYIDLFNCNDNGGRSAPLPAQNYLTWIEITDDTGGTTYTVSTAEFVNITNFDMNFDTEILVDGGYFKLSWSLMGETSGQALSCAQTAAAKSKGGSVETTATINGTATALSDKFDCEDHFGYSAPLPWGTYTIAVDALNSDDQAITSSSAIFSDKTIGSVPNSIKDLGHAVLTIAGM